MIESIEKGRQEDGNRSIADKIIKRLNDLDNTVENNQGRWAWELLQNAKDSVADVDAKISIQIELNEDSVEFRHNGIHFTEKDIRGLINQISSKEIEDETESKKTGRFGTGFLTTHLLSKEIEIKGVVKTDDNKFYHFKFPLNREGKTTSTLIPKIEEAWTKFHESVSEISYTHDTASFDTSFNYKLNNEDKKNIARIGIDEFIKLIPFVMSSILKVESVEIIDNTTNKKLQFKNNDNVKGFITSITKIEDSEHSEVLILKYSNDKVSICCGLDKTDKGYAIKNITNLPKLFCDFPLIGTESFHFPIIVNSFYFNPLTERDGIWLKGTNDHAMENKSLLLSALELYQKLIKEISDQDYFNFFNIIETKLPKTNPNYFDENWYKENIQKTLRGYLTSLNIVELENGDKKSIQDLWFPNKSYTESVKNKLWQYIYDLFPLHVSKKIDFLQWSKKIWDGWNIINYETLTNSISKKENINKLSKSLNKDNTETYDWLNSVREFLLELETNKPLFEKYSITPNQNEVLKKKDEVYIDKIKDNELIEILSLLGSDWKDILLNKKINFGRYQVKEKKDIAIEITRNINNPQELNEDYNKSIILLSEWLENNNPKEVNELFSELNRKKAELFMNTISDKESLYKIMKNTDDLNQLSDVASAIKENPKLLENIQKTNELTSILNEYNLDNISQLKEILQASNYNNSSKLDLTQEHLAGLGVTSLEELEKALEDPDLSKMFHESRPNTNAFLYAQKLITRAKQNIINHLKTLKEYDCSDLEELSTTVIGGIKKDGLLMHIVVRPSDNNQVIIYYGSEKDTLDFVNAELWIENGHDKPRCLTLGRILKNTGINKIPV